MRNSLVAQGLQVVDRAGTPLVKGIDLEVCPGGVTCLLGPSGAGKSLTLLALAGLLPPGFTRRGRVALDGREVGPEEVRRHLLGRRLGVVLQEPARSLHPALTVADQVGEGLRVHRRLRGAELRSAVLEALEREGLHPADRIAGLHPHRLSGGMRQRVLLASILVLQPDFLLLDEPVAALDAIRTANLVARLHGEVRERGMGVLLVTHDLRLLQALADRALFMDRGALLAAGPAAAFLADPGHPRAEAFLAGEAR